MKKLVFVIILGIVFTSCQKEVIEPTPVQPTPDVVIDTTGTGGNTIDSTLIKFSVRTIVPTQYLDSVVIVQAITGNPIDTLVILPTDIVGLDMGVDGKIIFNASQIVLNTIEEVYGQQFKITIYLNTTINYNSTNNRFEFGYNNNTETPSNSLNSYIFPLTGNWCLEGFQG